jgi:transposase
MALHSAPSAPNALASLAAQQPPLLAHETVYIGIDIGKWRHVAGFVSTTLLTWHRRFEGCPVLLFDNSREGFRLLLDRIRSYVPLEQAACLMEKTGHYHLALVDYLLELDVSVYLMHVHKRPRGMLKTDKRDALMLANHLYNQLGKGVQLPERTQLARLALPPSETAAQLKGLIGHRHELVHECTQRKNQLTAICDQLCPELNHVFKDPNSAGALAVRERYPTAQALAASDLDALCAAKGRHRPGREELAHLQDLAAHSIGVKEPHRLDTLVFEQQQLIGELQIFWTHLDAIDAKVTHVLEDSREGRILRSIPGIGVYAAAAILAAIGNIANFPSAAALKSYFGWAPRVQQSGDSVNTVALSRVGERTMKPVMYLAALSAIRRDTEWAALYQRLVERKCSYDERLGRYRGRKKVIGRIAGQMTAMIYGLLRAEAELRARTPTGIPLPEPRLYDRAIHHAHRTGAYRSMHRNDAPEPIVQLPKR